MNYPPLIFKENNMDRGIILRMEKNKLHESLDENTNEKVVNFIIDPTKTITYKTIEKSVKKKLSNSNTKIFYSIKNKKILQLFLSRLIQYNLSRYLEIMKTSVHYIIYINFVSVLGNPNHFLNEFNELVKGTQISVVLLLEN